MQATRADLDGQIKSHSAINLKTLNLGLLYQGANTVMKEIQSKKNRNNVILAVLCSICIFLIIVYTR
jgi:hypothetical protein